MYSTKKLVLEDRFEAYNLPLGCISHAIRAQAGGLPGALSKVGLDIFVDPRLEGPGINNISKDDSLVKYVELDGEESSTTSCRLSTWLSSRELLPTARATSHLRICLPQEMRCPSVRL